MTGKNPSAKFVREYNFLQQDKNVIIVFPEELVSNDRGGQKLDQWTAKQLKSEQYDAVRITWNKTRGLLHLRHQIMWVVPKNEKNRKAAIELLMGMNQP